MLITSKDLAAITGASYRQIDYWCRIGLISPLGNPRPGSGYHRQFEGKIADRVTFLANISKIFNHSLPQDILKMINDQYEHGSIELGKGITLSWG